MHKFLSRESRSRISSLECWSRDFWWSPGLEVLTRSWSRSRRLRSGPDLPIGYIGLNVGPQDPRGPPGNCGTQIAYMIKSINIRQNLMS